MIWRVISGRAAAIGATAVFIAAATAGISYASLRTSGPSRATRVLPSGVTRVVSTATSTESSELASDPTFPRNSAGETYGSVDGVIAADEPELILAVGEAPNGQPVTGYVNREERNAANGADIKTPSEAAALAARTEQGPTTIPLYAQNGATVVGTFTLGGVSVPPGTTP